MLTCALAALALVQPPTPAELPLVEVTTDNTVLTQSCRVRIAPGAVIADADGNGVIQVGFDNGEVRFEEGSVLRGAARGSAPDTYGGTGVRIEGHKAVTIAGVRIEGFKVGLHATR